MAYLKDAFKSIYQHPSWKQEAKSHEAYFARKLYSTGYVKEAARTALVRFSKVLQAYHFMTDYNGVKKQRRHGRISQLCKKAETIWQVFFSDTGQWDLQRPQMP